MAIHPRQVCIRVLLPVTAALLLPVAARSAAPPAPKEGLRVARTAEEFARCWRARNDAKLKRLVELPCDFILPCKGGPRHSWADIREAVRRMGIDPGSGKLVTVVTSAAYLKSFEPEARGWSPHWLRRDVFVVYMQEEDDPKSRFALLLRANGPRVRVIGLGMVVPEGAEE